MLYLLHFNYLANAGEHRFGIVANPFLAICSVKPNTCSTGFSGGFEGGFSYDYVFRDNHCIGTGIQYIYKGLKIKINGTNATNNSDYSFGVNYVKVPVLLKLYSGEIFIDTQLFLYTGCGVSIKINEIVPNHLTSVFSSDFSLFKLFDFDFMIGGGIDHEFAMNTNLFFAIGYSVSPLNIVNVHDKIAFKRVSLHSILFLFGIRF